MLSPGAFFWEPVLLFGTWRVLGPSCRGSVAPSLVRRRRGLALPLCTTRAFLRLLPEPAASFQEPGSGTSARGFL